MTEVGRERLFVSEHRRWDVMVPMGERGDAEVRLISRIDPETGLAEAGAVLAVWPPGAPADHPVVGVVLGVERLLELQADLGVCVRDIMERTLAGPEADPAVGAVARDGSGADPFPV